MDHTECRQRKKHVQAEAPPPALPPRHDQKPQEYRPPQEAPADPVPLRPEEHRVLVVAPTLREAPVAPGDVVGSLEAPVAVAVAVEDLQILMKMR